MVNVSIFSWGLNEENPLAILGVPQDTEWRRQCSRLSRGEERTGEESDSQNNLASFLKRDMCSIS